MAVSSKLPPRGPNGQFISKRSAAAYKRWGTRLPPRRKRKVKPKVKPKPKVKVKPKPPRKPVKRPKVKPRPKPKVALPKAPRPRGPDGRFISYKVKPTRPRDKKGRFIKTRVDHRLTKAEKKRRKRLAEEQFVKTARGFLSDIKHSFPDLEKDAEVRWHPNADGTIDVELRFRRVPEDVPEFLLELQDAYREYWPPELQDWWVRIAQVFDKKDEAELREEGYTGEDLQEKVDYTLPIFRDKETVSTNVVRKSNPVGLAPVVFEAASSISKNVEGIDTHKPSQVILRLYYSEERPVY